MALVPRSVFDWHLRSRIMTLGVQTKIMGILNVTPDSFSDGGQFASVETAVRQALVMLDEGAHLIDIGGESTRPNSQPLTPAEEQTRVMPVLEAILKERPATVISIDTFHATTAKIVVEAGAEIVNDVSGFTWDPEMAGVCAELDCGVVLMHTRGRPREWLGLPRLVPGEVVSLVLQGLEGAVEIGRTAGIGQEKMMIDPGFGFGKLGEENYELLAGLGEDRKSVV